MPDTGESRVGAPEIFICGVGRSGTSLLHSMLSSHREFAFPPETHFIRRYIAKRTLQRVARNGGIAGVIRTLQEDEYVGRLNVDVEEVVRAAWGSRSVVDVAIYDALLSRYAEREDKPRVGDKDPRLVELLPVLARYWPRAHVVHIVRDPRDVLVSKKAAAWSSARPRVWHVAANRLQFRLAHAEGPKCFGRQYHEVKYEDLIQEPAGTLEKLCGELGIAFDTGMLEFQRASKKLVTERELSWKRETMGPVLPQNFGKWSSALADWEVALVETACAETLRWGRYAPSGAMKRLGLATRAGVRLAALVVELGELVVRLGRRVECQGGRA